MNRQARKGAIGTPKGRTRRSVAMTTTLIEALKAIPPKVVNDGDRPVVDLHGNAVRDGYVLWNRIVDTESGR